MKQEGAMIEKFESPPGAVHVTVTEDRLLEMSMLGYTLIAVLYSDKVEPFADTDSTPITDPGWSQPNRFDVVTKTVHHVVRAPLFLLRMDGETALQQKVEELTLAKEEARESQRALREVEKSKGTLEKEVGLLKKKVEAEEAERTSRNKQYMSTVDAKHKLESDMSKLRNAIGEIRMKEIVGT